MNKFAYSFEDIEICMDKQRKYKTEMFTGKLTIRSCIEIQI